MPFGCTSGPDGPAFDAAIESSLLRRKEAELTEIRTKYDTLLAERDMIQNLLKASMRGNEKLHAENVHLRTKALNPLVVSEVDEIQRLRAERDKLIEAAERLAQALGDIQNGWECSACSCCCHVSAGKTLAAFRKDFPK